MEKVIKSAFRSLSSGSNFDAREAILPDAGGPYSLEPLLRSLEQDEAQSRLLEEESLNKLIYTSFILKQKGSSRIVDEFAKAINRDDCGPNCLRVCLGTLSHIHIKPQKLGATMSHTLLPAFTKILDERCSEGLLAALADHIDPLMRVFGPYALSQEVENFIAKSIAHLLNGGEDHTPSIRRSISACLIAVASHNKARNHFISWAFTRLMTEFMEKYHPEKGRNSALLGLFSAYRAFIPLLKDIEESYNVLQDIELEQSLFMLYELSLTVLEQQSSSPGILSANLELLHTILKNPPLSLKLKLLSTQGFVERTLPFEETYSQSDDGGFLGSFTDKDIPLIYAARLIVSKTLLTPEKGVPHSDIRISIRSLGLSCMSAIVSLSPKIFLLTLYMNQDEEDFESTPLLRDIVSREHFLLHPDPQVSGATAVLLGHVLRGCLLETGGNEVHFWFNHRRPDQEDIIGVFMEILSSPQFSPITIKYALTAISSFIGILLRSSLARQGTLLLWEVVSDNNALWKSSYWLVKSSLLELLSSVNYKRVHYVSNRGFELQNNFLHILRNLFSDEDPRVRSSASESLVNAIPNLYYPCDWENECTESASRCFFLIRSTFDQVIQRVAHWLWELLATADNPHQLSGALEAYFGLKRQYPHVSLSTDASVLDLVFHYITSNSNFILDVNNHVLSLNVINLSLSIGANNTKEDIFRHCVRLLNMMYLLLEDSSLNNSPHSTSNPPQKPNVPSQSSNKKEEESSHDGLLGSFSGSPHYSKMFASLKKIYGTYIISSPSTKEDPSNKFGRLLQSTLKTLKSLLMLRCIGNCDEELAQEILKYLSPIMSLDPFNTLSCVQSLLSYIFKTNEEPNEAEAEERMDRCSLENASFYKHAFEIPHQEFVARAQLPKASMSSGISFFDDKINLRRLSVSFLKRALSLKNWNRDALASYIRLFEPIVIQALQFYTISSRAKDQGQVLSLLIQLVKLRVNYCLLDSDKVFVGYVIRHLEYIKDGNVLNAEVIMPKIFQFLVLLSVDKFHSKVVVPVDDIVNLLTELTSTKNHRWIIPAACPVVEVLFGNWHIHDNMSNSDMEATREKFLKLLLNYMSYPEILEVIVSKLCFVKSEGEDRWRKVSRILFDHILVLLSSQKLELVDSSSLQTLYSFFLCLAPGTLRPVDSLLSCVLTSSVDLGSIKDVQRWLGFVVVSLCIITNQSPEEGILSRLEEFGITLINNQNLNAVKPENTFAKFLFQIMGASLSKLHQIVYSLDQFNSFLEEEITWLLNFVIYVLQSGRYCRVCKASQIIAEGEDAESLLYSLDFIDNIVLELSHVYPFITLRWAWILTLLKRVQTPYWSKLMSFDSHLLSLEKAILQKGGLVLLCGYLCETNPMEESNVELVTWLVSNFSHLIVENIKEEPIGRFISSVHGKASLSGLFLQAIISRCQHRLASSILFQKRTLLALEELHESQSSNLLMFLIQRVSPKAHLSLSARIQAMCCKRVEGILNSSSPRELLSSQELSSAVQHMKKNKDRKRYGRLLALLNELMAKGGYPELNEHMEGGERSFSPSSLLGLKPDKAWFLSQLKSKCRDVGLQQDTKQCAQMLSWLNSEEDIKALIASPDFNLGILEWLFSDPSSGPILLRTAKEQFFSFHLKRFLEKHLSQGVPLIYGPSDWGPSNSEARYKDRMNSNFNNKVFRDTLSKSLYIIPLIPGDLLTYDQDVATLKQISFLLALEFAKWLHFYCTDTEMKGQEELKAIIFSALNYVFKNPRVSSQISTEEATLGVHALYSILLGDEDISQSRMPSCLRYTEIIAEKGSKNSVVLAALKINRLFACLLSREKFLGKESYRGPIANVILGLCRLPCFNSYVSVPLEVWRQGWSDGIPFGPQELKFPLISVYHLQEIDILREYSVKVNAIGWSNRPQFEETWLSLLGIFSIFKDDMSQGDIFFLGHCSALVVRTATNLLLKTLYSPYPGLSNASRLICHSRLQASDFMSTKRGLALSTLQSKMSTLFSKSRPSGTLPIYSSRNLERLLGHDYGSGQLSTSYILSGIKYYSKEGALDGSEGLSADFRSREEALTCLGLDIESCLQFLFDLYSSWFKSPKEAPLVLLTEAVRSVLVLSDIFIKKQSFEWMLSHFCELLKSHPSDDEILISLLRVGICKALSILDLSLLFGSDASLSFDQFMRLLQAGYISTYLPAQISTLQGSLYILQRLDSFNDITSPLFNYLVRTSVEYLQDNLFCQSSPCQDSHMSLCWSLAFYLLEHYDFLIIDTPWAANVLQLALSTAGKTNTPNEVYLVILSGFERLILADKLSRSYPGSVIRTKDEVSKLTTDLLTESNPVLVIPSLQLFISTMYIEGWSHLGGSEDASTPERLMHALEQISILFDCIRRSGPKEATFLCQILPIILVDFFPAADVINRVICEFIGPGQPHQPLLAGVMFKVFNEASREHSKMLQDWVLSTLPTFTKRSPISHSAWCLSCFFLSVPPPQIALPTDNASDYWLQALFPHLQTRLGCFTPEDRKLFCLVAKEFYSHLEENEQQEKFLSAFKEAAHPKTTPYCDLLQIIDIN